MGQIHQLRGPFMSEEIKIEIKIRRRAGRRWRRIANEVPLFFFSPADDSHEI